MKCVLKTVLVLCAAIAPWSSDVFADPLNDENILVITDEAVMEFTLDGTWVQSFPIPYPGTEVTSAKLRDAVVSEDGNVQIYNGTFEAFLTTLDPATSTIEHRNGDGFCTFNNGTYGGVAAYKNFVFVTDQGTSTYPGYGIVRFNMNDGTFVRFNAGIGPLDEEYSDVSVGENGILYAHGYYAGHPNPGYDMFDPTTLEHLGRVSYTGDVWITDIRGIDADRDGNVYVIGYGEAVFKLDPQGNLLKALYFGDEIRDTGDIDISENGTILVGSRFGEVIVTSTELDSYYSFNSPYSGTGHVDVAFAKPRTFEIPPPREAVIDVDPSSTDNQVKLKGKLKPLFVALLGENDLDLTNGLDLNSALLGDPILTDPDFGTGLPVPAVSHSVEDVNGDTIDDVVFEFDLEEMLIFGAIDDSSTELLLTTQLYNGGVVFGLDAINQSPKGGGKGNGRGKNK